MARKVLKRKTRRQRKTRKTRKTRALRGGGAESGDYGGAQTGLPKNGDYSDVDAVPRTQSIGQLREEEQTTTQSV